MDAEIGAAEARTDTKFAELKGDIARLFADLKADLMVQLEKRATKGTVWTAVGTMLGIALATMALATNRFDAGMTVAGVTTQIVNEQHQRDDKQDRKLDEILSRLPKPAPTGVPATKR